MSNSNCKLCTPQKLEDVNTVMFTKEKKTIRSLRLGTAVLWDWACEHVKAVLFIIKPNDAENVFIWKLILIYDKDGKKDGKWRTTVVL